MHILCACYVLARNVQAEHAELVGPLDTLSEYGTERLQQGISFLFRDKGHPSPNFWSNHRAALSIFSVQWQHALLVTWTHVASGRSRAP